MVNLQVDPHFTATTPIWEIYSLPRFRDGKSRQQVFEKWTALCRGSDAQRQRGLEFPTAKPAADLLQLIIKQLTTMKTIQPEDLPEQELMLHGLSLSALQVIFDELWIFD